MRLLSRLDDERKSGAIWYAIFRQSPKAMELDYRGFVLVVSLAAILTGLGIVRILSAFAETLRRQGRIELSN